MNNTCIHDVWSYKKRQKQSLCKKTTSGSHYNISNVVVGDSRRDNTP